MKYHGIPFRPRTFATPKADDDLLTEHANAIRKLASDVATQHLTLMLVGDGSPMNNLVRDTVGANRRSMEEAADRLQRLARERRLQPSRLPFWQSVLRLGIGVAVGITLVPFALMVLFWSIDEIAPPGLWRAPTVDKARDRPIMPQGAGAPVARSGSAAAASPTMLVPRQ